MNKKPDILLIMPDQMRGDCLSLEKHPVLLTPNIDEIGMQGAHFQRAYSTCPSCIPARMSLLTGLYPATTGMVGYSGGYPINSQTLPQVLGDAGYHTALVGRHMHQHPYEEKYGYQTQILGSTYIDNDDYAQYIENEAPGSGGVKGHGISFNGWTAKPWQLADYLHPTNWITMQSREVIRNHTDSKPLFITTSYYAPHPPLIPPAFYYERYKSMNLPETAIGNWAKPPLNDGIGIGVEFQRVNLHGEALQSAQAGYFGLINHLDDQLYWLIFDFKNNANRNNRPWVIIFTSDHGEMLGDHYYFRKCEPYEGSARIPFLIQTSADYGFKGGMKIDQPVCLEDIMPTILDLADIPFQKTDFDGKSLVSALTDKSSIIRNWLHGEHSPCYSIEQAHHYLTDGRMKYIWRPSSGEEELFNLINDPTEMNNLSGNSENQQQLLIWRERMCEELRDRVEGFVKEGKLISGCEYPAIQKR